MRQKSHCVYSPEIIQVSSLGKVEKKLLEHNDCLYRASVLEQRVRKSPNEQCSQSTKLITNKLSKCYSSGFKKLLNNTGKICLNIILQARDMFLHTGLTELHIFFVTRSTTFFSSTVFVISMFVFFLVRRQSSQGVL